MYYAPVRSMRVAGATSDFNIQKTIFSHKQSAESAATHGDCSSRLGSRPRTAHLLSRNQVAESKLLQTISVHMSVKPCPAAGSRLLSASMKLPRQLLFKSRGGRRKGAGRRKHLASEPSHAKREPVTKKTPLHLTLRCLAGVPTLRSKYFLFQLGRMIALAKLKGLSINHFAIESNHIHLIAEASSNKALARGMMSLIASVRAALKEVFGYSGKCLVGRFHTHLLKTPTEMKRALKYVLFNHAKHCGMKPFIDFFSSAALFEEIGLFSDEKPPDNRWLWPARVAISQPESWLQMAGWKRAR
jgi:REP element-mobilizing transposase RayT